MATYQAAHLDDWVRATQRRMDAVVKDATQSVVKLTQVTKAKGGSMPVDTGFLRNSLVSSLNGGTAMGGESSGVLIAGLMQAGDVAEFGWTAAYSRRVNFGFTGTDSRGRAYNQSGAHFLEAGTSQWQRVVAEAVAKAKIAAGAT